MSSLLAPIVAFLTANPALAVAVIALTGPVVLVGAAMLLGRTRTPAVEPPPVIEATAAVEAPAAAEPAVTPQPAPEAPGIAPAESADAPGIAPAESADAPAAPLPAPEPVRLRDRLARTREALVGRVGGLLGGRSLDDDALAELEALLFSADLGVRTADDLLETVRKEASGRDAGSVERVLRDAIRRKLERVESRAAPSHDGPRVILVLGVNGSGKTTTIGKLAARHRAQGHRVVLGAGDTFRAAAIEQLQAWGDRVECEVVAGSPGGDPAAVAFDTVKAAVARKADVAIIDTAGRLQTQKPLMEELSKIARVLGREIEGAPHETLLVIDANTGQNAISQARLFTEAAPVTGLALTKLDGTAKGGVLVGLADELGIPVRYVGLGEGVDDLRDFSAEEFVDALFDA